MSNRADAGRAEARRSESRRLAGRHQWIGLSLVIASAVISVYKLQPDTLTFATVFPVWCWWIPGLFCAGIGWRRARWPMRRLVAAVWLVVIWYSSDVPAAVLRRPPATATESTANDTRTPLRVVSFNTGSERPGSPDEIDRWRPDIVLLQESYSRDAVARLARELFGNAAGYLWGSENSILARGSVVSSSPGENPAQTFVLAKVRIVDGPTLYVANLRLAPQPVRFDLWSPNCWCTYADLRRKHREQLTTILKHCDGLARDALILIGGDFNAPAGDAIFRLMRPKYADAFHEAGRGWGCTLPNDLPLLRIDQIWTSSQLDPIAAWAVKSEKSDHRMVIADYRVNARWPSSRPTQTQSRINLARANRRLNRSADANDADLIADNDIQDSVVSSLIGFEELVANCHSPQRSLGRKPKGSDSSVFAACWNAANQ